MFATESIASFLSHAILRHPHTPRPAANTADGVWMRLTPCAMGTRPRDTPRLCRGRIAGEVEELGHRKLSSLSVSFAPNVRTQVPENKNRAADVPAELRHALHRRLPARRNGELGARVTSGRDSRETQSVNGGLRVVNPFGGSLTRRRRDAGENCDCMAHTETQSHRENRKTLSLWLSVPSVASV
jgi:hypothetical protein